MNTWAPQFASCEAPEEPDPAQQDQQQQQQSQQRLLEAAAALQRQQQQLQQNAAKRQRTASVSRAPEATKTDSKAEPPTQLLRQQQLVAAAAASGQRSATPAAQQQLQLQQQLQQGKLTQGQQQQHPGASGSTGAGGQLQQLQLLQQQQLQLLQQQQVRLLDAARRATPNAAAGAPGTAVAAASASGGAGSGSSERREGVPETNAAAASTTERGGKWLECRSCKKWRRLPPDVDAEALRPKFFCYLNMWDPQHNTCASPQEPWQQLQQHQEVQGKTPPAANASSAAPLQKAPHQPAPSDANRQDKADNVAATPAQQQQLPRPGGQLQGEAGGAASLHQQLQEQQLLLLRMQQQQQRAASSSGVAGGSTTKPGSGASGAAAGPEDDDEEGEDDIEGEGDEDEDSEDTGDSSDSESDRGGGGGPSGGAGAGGPSSGGSSGTGAGAGGGAARTPQPPTQGPPGTGSFGATAAGGGGVAAEVEFGAAKAVKDSKIHCNQRTVSEHSARFFDVLIVGGGVAGLAGALHFHRAGVDYQVIEARGRLGGRVWSITLPASSEEQRQRQQKRIGRKACGRKGSLKKDGSVCIDGGANYMHGLTGNENDVRLKPRRKGCSVFHLAAASPECRVAVVPGETGWENPYYFDWLRGGRRFCMLVVSLAHALFSRLATPVSLTAGQQEAGNSVSVLTLLNREAAALLKAEGTADAAAASSRGILPACEIHQADSGNAETPPHQNTFESLDLPSALKGLVATLLQRLKKLCSLAISRVEKGNNNRSEGEIAVGECCACQVEAMVVRMLRSRFGFVAPLGDVSAAFFAFFQTPKLKRDVERYHNPKYRLLACRFLVQLVQEISLLTAWLYAFSAGSAGHFGTDSLASFLESAFKHFSSLWCLSLARAGLAALCQEFVVRLCGEGQEEVAGCSAVCSYSSLRIVRSVRILCWADFGRMRPQRQCRGNPICSLRLVRKIVVLVAGFCVVPSGFRLQHMHELEVVGGHASRPAVARSTPSQHSRLLCFHFGRRLSVSLPCPMPLRRQLQ